MFGFGRRERPARVHVEFFDAETGARFAEVDLPLEQLPQSFEAATTMHLGEQDWHVERAEPVTATAFAKTGRLRLVMRRVKLTTIDPREVLFSLPTISDELPAIAPDSTKLGRDVLELREDDWRQTEFVSASLGDAVETCLAAVRNVYEVQRDGVGFKNLHVRREVPRPLDDTHLTLDDLRDAVGGRAAWLDGIAFAGVAGVVAGGYAVRLLSSLELYGLADGDRRVHTLCVANARVNNVGGPDVAALRELAASQRLLLVDWCSAAQYTPFEGGFETFFEG